MAQNCNGDNGCCCPQGQFCSTFVTGQGGPGKCQGKITGGGRTRSDRGRGTGRARAGWDMTPGWGLEDRTRRPSFDVPDIDELHRNQTGCGFRNFSDSDMYSNHPGLFGWCWKGKRKCEADRVEKQESRTNDKHPFSKNDDCDTLDDRITKIDNDITATATASAGGRGAERVKNRTLAALEKRRLQIKKAYEEQDCSQQRLDLQAQEFNRMIMSRFDEQYARDSQREEDDTLMYVALGVGILVIGAVIVIAR